MRSRRILLRQMDVAFGVTAGTRTGTRGVTFRCAAVTQRSPSHAGCFPPLRSSSPDLQSGRCHRSAREAHLVGVVASNLHPADKNPLLCRLSYARWSVVSPAGFDLRPPRPERGRSQAALRKYLNLLPHPNCQRASASYRRHAGAVREREAHARKTKSPGPCDRPGLKGSRRD